MKTGVESNADCKLEEAEELRTQRTMANQMDEANKRLSNLDLVQACDKYECMITKMMASL